MLTILHSLKIQIGVSFHPPASLGFQQLFVDAETKFSKEPLHSFITTSIPQGECDFHKPTPQSDKKEI